MGFKGGPDEKGEMDLGYSVLPSFRGNGYATEMAIASVKWGLKQPNVKRITAICSNDNFASIWVLEKSGFKQVGIGENKIYWAIENMWIKNTVISLRNGCFLWSLTVLLFYFYIDHKSKNEDDF